MRAPNCPHQDRAVTCERWNPPHPAPPPGSKPFLQPLLTTDDRAAPLQHPCLGPLLTSSRRCSERLTLQTRVRRTRVQAQDGGQAESCQPDTQHSLCTLSARLLFRHPSADGHSGTDGVCTHTSAHTLFTAEEERRTRLCTPD